MKLPKTELTKLERVKALIDREPHPTRHTYMHTTVQQAAGVLGCTEGLARQSLIYNKNATDIGGGVWEVRA